MAETTGIINGSDLRVMLEADGTTPVMVDNLTDCSISVTTEMKDTTTKSNAGYRALLPGMHSATITFSAMYASDATNGFNEIIDHQINKTKLDVKFTHIVGTGSTENVGDERFTVEAYVTSCDLNGGTEDNSTFTVTLDVVGTITREVIA